MVKKVVFMVVIFAFISFVLSCGPAVDSKLVGSWEDIDSGDILVFTDDGKMGLGYDVEDMGFGFEYTASRGKGEYWFADHPDIKQSFTYSISGSALTFKVPGGYSGSFKRLK